MLEDQPHLLQFAFAEFDDLLVAKDRRHHLHDVADEANTLW